jgi:hypothetical protein
MRTLPARILLTIAVLGATAVVAPSASAASTDSTTGGCAFFTNAPPLLGSTTYTGVVYDVSATQDAHGLPTGATVSCQVQVDGVAAPGTTFSYSGYGEQAGADPVSYEARDDQIVNLCQRTVYADATDTGWICAVTDPFFFPPQPVLDLLDFVFDTVNGVLIWDVDPRVCPIFAAHPGTYGPITIQPDGDIYIADPIGLAGNPFYDCPPYESL